MNGIRLMVERAGHKVEKEGSRKSFTGYNQHQQLKVLPDNWDFRQLKDISTQVVQKAKDQKLETLSISAGIGFINQAEKFGKELSGKQYVSYTVVRKGDFVYNKGNSKSYPQGCIYRLEDREISAVPNVFISFRLKKKSLESDYYKHLFISGYLNPQLVKLINAGVRNDGLLNLYNEDFFSCSVPVPPLLEQQKIAEILNLSDKIIDLKLQLIEQEKERKKWLLQSLLNPNNQARHRKTFKEWKTVALGNLFFFGPSLSASRAELGTSGICYLHYGDIHSNPTTTVDIDRDFTSLPKIQLTHEKYDSLQNGDVVFVDASVDYAGVSKFVVVNNPRNIPFVPGLHTIPGKSKTNDLDINFKKYLFQASSFKRQASFYASGMKVYGLTKNNLAKIMVSFPELREQEAISKVLMSEDRTVALYEQELNEWQKRKKSLMQLLLLGIVRVWDEEAQSCQVT